VESRGLDVTGRKLVDGPGICTFIGTEDDRLGAVGGGSWELRAFLPKKTCWEPRAEQPAAASAIIEKHRVPARSCSPLRSARPAGLLQLQLNREEHLPVLRQRPAIVGDAKLQCVADFSYLGHRVGAFR